MMAAALPHPLLTRRPTAVLLLLASAALLGCDPVDETEAPEPTAAEERPRAERSARDEADEDRAAELDRERAAQEAHEAQEAETVAADVAAGLVDAGPAGDAPLEGDDVTAGAAGPSAAAEGSHDVYVRPVIHPDVIENLRILRFALAEDVVDREPVMVSSSFRRDSGPMHVFLEVRNETSEDIQLFVGFRPASVPQRGGGVTLSIPPSPRYRTRARTNTLRSVGEWVCEIMDERQRVLATQRFWITPAAAPAPTAEPGPTAAPATE